MVPVKNIVGKFMATFKDFPPKLNAEKDALADFIVKSI